MNRQNDYYRHGTKKLYKMQLRVMKTVLISASRLQTVKKVGNVDKHNLKI